MRTKNLFKTIVGIMVVGMLIIGIMIPMSAATQIEQTAVTDATTASSSVISLNQSSVSIVEGGTASLVATTQPSGLSVTWESSKSYVATVNSSGVVNAIKAGVTFISASVEHNGSTYTVNCTIYVYIRNGVYYFNNISNKHRIEFSDSISYGENEPLTAWESDSTEPSERFSVFKLTYLGNGLYSIRSMLDNNMGWISSNSKLLCASIGTSDSSIPYAAKWYIRCNNNDGYYIYNQSGSSQTITCPSNIYEDWDITLSIYSSSKTSQNWTIKPISTSYRGVEIHKSTSSMSIGDTFNYVAATYSTYAGENTLPIRWKTTNSRIASVNNTTGLVTANNSGRIRISAYLYNYPSIESTTHLTVKPQTVQTTGIESGAVYMIKNVSKNDYLKAYSKDELRLAQKNDMDGEQLWYIEWTGNGYKLYSMGIKALTPGALESLLRGNTVSSSPIISCQMAHNVWTISNYNGYYYLTNNSSAYNSTSISANANNYKVNSILLDNENSYAQWSFEKITTTTFNNYYPGEYNDQGSHVYIKVSSDSSLYTNNYVNDSIMEVVNEWNGLSSNVTIYDLNDTVPSSVSPFNVTYYGYTPSDPDEYGFAQPFQKTLWWYTETTLDDDFDKVDIYINTASSNIWGNQFPETIIESVIVHELGHALKLAHPKAADDLFQTANGRYNYLHDNCVVANMNQGNPFGENNLAASTPKWHDKINLKNKFGG